MHLCLSPSVSLMANFRFMPGSRLDYITGMHWHFTTDEASCPEGWASHRLSYIVRDRRFEAPTLKAGHPEPKPLGRDATPGELLNLLPDAEKAYALAASITRTSERR
jgi:hypothetical protein